MPNSTIPKVQLSLVWLPNVTLSKVHLSIMPHSCLVLTTGLANLRALGVPTAHTGRFGSRPIQKPYLLSLGRPHLDPYLSTWGFCQVWLHTSVPISGSASRVSHLWSHSHMLLLIVTYWHWYVRVCFWHIGRPNDQNQQRHAPYNILKMSVNRVSTIVGRVSGVIWGATGYTQSWTKYWPPL